MIVPEVRGNECTGLTLLHCRFHDRLPSARRVRPVVRGQLPPAGLAYGDAAD